MFRTFGPCTVHSRKNKVNPWFWTPPCLLIIKHTLISKNDDTFKVFLIRSMTSHADYVHVFTIATRPHCHRLPRARWAAECGPYMTHMQSKVCSNDLNAICLHSTARKVEAVSYVLSRSNCERRCVEQHCGFPGQIGKAILRYDGPWGHSSQMCQFSLSRSVGRGNEGQIRICDVHFALEVCKASIAGLRSDSAC